MNIRNMSSIPEDEIIEGDVCIVGSGPAGGTIVRELASSNLRVILLESGGLDIQTSADALNEIENVGMPRGLDQSLARNRVLGGTSYLWGGRCVGLDEIDYQQRAWVPHSVGRSVPMRLSLSSTGRHLTSGWASQGDSAETISGLSQIALGRDLM